MHHGVTRSDLVLREAQFQYEPYPIGYCENILPQHLYAELLKNWPDTALFQFKSEPARTLLGSNAKPRSLQVEINARYKDELLAFLREVGYEWYHRHDTELGKSLIDKGQDPEQVAHNALFRPVGAQPSLGKTAPAQVGPGHPSAP